MDDMVSWSRSLRLPPVSGSVAKARDFTSLHLTEHGLEALVDDVRLVTSELATNAVQHAATPFTVLLEGADQLVRVIVSDDSPARPVPATPSPSDTVGWGLRIVESTSREWGVSNGTPTAKSVWAVFGIDRRGSLPDSASGA
jgi:anti-sigma regulatory factor (Ser/Thr protein kinase)